MKTFFEKLFASFQIVSQPAGELFQKITTPRKRRGRTAVYTFLSPDCFNIRGASSRKDDSRQTPAP
jgi:hypothetical protein